MKLMVRKGTLLASPTHATMKIEREKKPTGSKFSRSRLQIGERIRSLFYCSYLFPMQIGTHRPGTVNQLGTPSMPTIPRTGAVADTVRTDLVFSLKCRTAAAAEYVDDLRRRSSLSL